MYSLYRHHEYFGHGNDGRGSEVAGDEIVVQEGVQYKYLGDLDLGTLLGIRTSVTDS